MTPELLLAASVPEMWLSLLRRKVAANAPFAVLVKVMIQSPWFNLSA